MDQNVTTLKNGLRVATDTINSVETVTLGVWVGAGSRHESLQNNGVAHFLEHMAFKGTSQRSALDIAQSIENVGGYMNAYTSRESTAYYVRVLKNDVELALDILADILQNSTFEPKELEREREVILQEIGQTQDTPDDIIFDYFQHQAYPDQPLGRPILGPSTGIKTMQRETLMDFMQTHYHPKRMVIGAAGNIEHTSLVQLVETYFNTTTQGAFFQADAGQYQGGTQYIHRDLEQMHLLLGFPGTSSLAEDIYAANIYTTLMGGGMSSRLFQEVREKRGLVYSIYAFTYPFEDCGLFGIYAGTSVDETLELFNVVRQELCASLTTLKDSEINRAKQQLKAHILMSLENTSGRARTLAQNLLTHNRLIPAQEMIEKIDAVTQKDLESFAKKIFQNPLTLTLLGKTQDLKSFEAPKTLL